MPGIIDDLIGIVGESGVILGDDVAARYPGYFMDRIEASAIVRPRSTEEVSRILAQCNAVGQPVVVQGGMSGWVRATQTRAGEIALSLERMNTIEQIDPVNRTATVQAGVVLATLQDAVAEHGLAFALDLGGRGSCQLGGNAATNAGGLRVIRYGMMREQVLGLEAVLPDGQVVSSLNRMIKNNTGYDLKQLFIGSEGTLGVITKLVLRLRELPADNSTALVSAESVEQLAGLLRHVDKALGGRLSAFELIDSDFYEVNTGDGRHRPPLAHGSAFYALIEAEGTDAAVFENALGDALARELCDDAVIASSVRERDAIWAIREDLEHIVRDFQPFLAFDVSLPVGDMADYMTEVRARLLGRWPHARIAFLGHMGDGNLHVAIGAGPGAPHAEVEACVYEPLRRVQGSVSAEHGIGLEKKPWLAISRSAIERDMMVRIKRLLDPRMILNPGKIFDLTDQREA
ncbi:FAD-binding oxidoreductase [Novosphingobium sp. KCTC 2891]|uniref:FAD-binding oxidoreductase n=1 Tax=Novosphingobium sp. KCTC 2891 TaxID=2989730 RepID=UPI0022219D52|nr:FAD-binding oxidoreductase [Novosphingobium sp. KCTC 2891]MCW1383777.1 FAD-binding oxidoreductase [Novosphingobium sp. KCTC 2891]